jgi:multidrug efflux pump subunit AcrB
MYVVFLQDRRYVLEKKRTKLLLYSSMTRFWSFFIHNKSFTLFLMIVLLLGGAYAVIRIPKEATPDISIPLGIISTALPGASAADTERLITDKIESGVLSVENVSKVTSTSGDGISVVSVEFVSSADIDKSIQSLTDAVDKIKSELPEDATDPSVTAVNFSDFPILEISISGDLAAGELTALGESVSDEIKRVPGVSRVNVSGVRDRQVQVIAHEDSLRQFGLSLSDITSAIRAAGVSSPAGTLTIDEVNYAVRFESGVESTDKVANIVITMPNGGTVRVADVADVIDGLENPSSYSRASVNGEPSSPSLTLTVFKTSGGNIVRTGNEVLERLDELQTTTLANTHTVISYNGAEEVGKSLRELTRAGIETVVLVVIVLYLTLGLRESLVAAASIPLSFLIAFIGLLASGNTLNNVSLFALILAIGILVDSGVVMVEAFHTRLRKYGNKEEAAIASIREYAWPLIAGTFTTIGVFVPLLFLTGIIGKFLFSIPFTLIFVLLASIFVALGFVPYLTIKYVKEGHSSIEDRQERYNAKAKAWYEGFLHRFLHDRKGQNRFMIGLGILLVLSFLLPATGLLKAVFFPADNVDYVYVQVEKPQGTSLEETDLTMREVEEVLYEDPNVESFVSQTGSASSFANSSMAGPSAGGNIGNITVNLHKERDMTSAEYVLFLRKELEGVTSAKITVGEPAGGPPAAAPITLTFTGDDLNELTATAERATQVLSDMEGVVNVNSSSGSAGAEFVISLDSAKAAELGVSPLVVADTLRTALYGSKATSIHTGKDDIEVHTRLDLNPDYQDPSQTTHATIDEVRSLTFPTQNGPVSLSSVATITYGSAQSSIAHEAGNRIITVTAEVAGDANAVERTTAFQERFTADKIGSGVTMKVGGAAEDINESFTQLFVALIAGAALMLAILVLEFNSFRHSFYLLLIIPLSLIGVFFGLTLVFQPLSLTSMLGVIALAGVIINHAIILMDSIARIHREQHDLSLEEVVIEAASTRLRPILLTTVVTVVGMIPLTLVSNFWAPLAFAIMFGLAFSLLLTLVLIPMLYYRWPGKHIKEQFVGEES